MTTEEIERLLRELYDQGSRRLAEALRRPAAGHDDSGERRCCLPPSRARVLALDPRNWTAGERQHASTCRRCERLVRAVDRQMVHPGWWDLLLWGLGRVFGADRDALRYHLEEGGCRRCRRLLGSSWLRSLADRVRAGSCTRERVEALTAGAAAAFVPLPATAGTVFAVRAVHPEGLLQTSLVGTEAGVLALAVQAADPGLSGRRVRVEVVGDCTLSAKVSLAPEGQGCAGCHTFGRLDDLKSRLGVDCALLAVLHEEPI
jgi:hypothetical protein